MSNMSHKDRISPPFELVFLVYDSRSGSTLLAREMTRCLDGVLVTTEIGFDPIIRDFSHGNRYPDWKMMLERMYRSDLRNLPISKERAFEICTGKDARQGILALLSELRDQSSTATAKWVVVKNGSHVKYLHALQKMFANQMWILHIVRDPRAVISSKLQTERPYVPGQVMAWAGSFFAALQWRSYVRSVDAARRCGMHVVEVRYEDLVSKPDEIMKKIGHRVGISTVEQGSQYQVPERERTIHSLIEGPIQEGRISGWKKSLQRRDRIIIETIAKKEMKALGYQDYERCGKVEKAIFLCAGAIESVIKISIEISRRLWNFIIIKSGGRR